jgi:hypothetical protein
VNYSLLHNQRPLFESFAIYNNTGTIVDGVEVQAILYAGGDSFPWRRRLTNLGEQPVELKDAIRVPLTSSLLRGVREAMQTVVFVMVSHHDRVIYQDTFPVALVPVEEWSSTPDEQQWLPSFVLPRDRAVDEIVRTARGALRSVRDQGDADFDGYQSVDDNKRDPYEDVDKQVQALWNTLSFHYDLGYIPPPPTYSSRAQRLRSPSTILGSQAGTCVDLALLMAACLEFIEIFPVIVIFDGHACVGYWRDEDLFNRFQLLEPPKSQTRRRGVAADDDVPPGDDTSAGDDVIPGDWTTGAGSASSGGPGVPWLIRRAPDGRKGVPREVRERVPLELVLLEATFIPKHLGFGEAQRAGRELLDQRSFRALVDITKARRNGVTPLPIDQP